MKETSKVELALAGLKKNRAQLRNQLSDLESELVFCYLPGEMKDRLCISLEEAIEILDEEIDNLEYDITQALNQRFGIKK